MEGIGRQTPHRLNEVPVGSRQVRARPDPDHPTSTAAQEFLADSLVVMAFNQMGYHYLDEGPRIRIPDRKGMAVAGNKPHSTPA